MSDNNVPCSNNDQVPQHSVTLRFSKPIQAIMYLRATNAKPVLIKTGPEGTEASVPCAGKTFTAVGEKVAEALEMKQDASAEALCADVGPHLCVIIGHTFEQELPLDPGNDAYRALPKLASAVFVGCNFKGFSLFKNTSQFIACEFLDCLISGQALVVACGDKPKDNFIGCYFENCGICGVETFSHDTYNGVIRYYVPKGAPLARPSCLFNKCEFGAIFERVVDFSDSVFVGCKVCSQYTPRGKQIFPDQGVTAAIQEFYPRPEGDGATGWVDNDFYSNFEEAEDDAAEWHKKNPNAGDEPMWVAGIENLLADCEG